MAKEIFKPGEVILENGEEKYRILGRVGRPGGFGIVYKAEQLAFGMRTKIVAIKALKKHLSFDEEYKIRFIREAQEAARISHENIVRILDNGTHNGILYMVMDYVDGEDLKELILRDGALPPQKTVGFACQLCGALSILHNLPKPIIHRDVKSRNILVSKKDWVKLTDFGIARVEGQEGLTGTGRAMGTVEYMSTEQARGRKDIDNRSDVYSLGIVLYEMLSGKLPFIRGKGETPVSVLWKHITERPKPLTRLNPLVPLRLENIVFKALEKEREKRYQKVEELLEDLSNFQGESLGAISFDSDPSEAQVYLDNKLTGHTPLTLKWIPPGTHNARIVKDEFRQWEGRVKVQAGQTAEIFVELKSKRARAEEDTTGKGIIPHIGSLSINCPLRGAKVYLDGRYEGEISFGPLHIPQISQGTHRVIIKKKGYRDWNGMVFVDAGENEAEIRLVKADFSLAKALSILTPLLIIGALSGIFFFQEVEVKFDSKPQGADLYVNNQLRGKTPKILKMKRTETFTYQMFLEKQNFKKEGKPKIFGKTIIYHPFKITSSESSDTDKSKPFEVRGEGTLKIGIRPRTPDVEIVIRDSEGREVFRGNLSMSNRFGNKAELARGKKLSAEKHLILINPLNKPRLRGGEFSLDLNRDKTRELKVYLEGSQIRIK